MSQSDPGILRMRLLKVFAVTAVCTVVAIGAFTQSSALGSFFISKQNHPICVIAKPLLAKEAALDGQLTKTSNDPSITGKAISSMESALTKLKSLLTTDLRKSCNI